MQTRVILCPNYHGSWTGQSRLGCVQARTHKPRKTQTTYEHKVCALLPCSTRVKDLIHGTQDVPHKAIWAKQGLIGPALHHTQINIFVFVPRWTTVFMEHCTSAKKLDRTRELPASRGWVIHNTGNPSMPSWQLVLINLVTYVDTQCFNLNVTRRFNITDTQCFQYAQLRDFWNQRFPKFHFRVKLPVPVQNKNTF